MPRRQRREPLTPDLTALIDMVFLLLIFFMVTSVFKKDEWALLLKLPTAQQGKAESKKTQEITVELSPVELALNGKKTSPEALKEDLANSDPSTIVNLRVDGKVEYNRLVEVLDILRHHKLENISLITIKN